MIAAIVAISFLAGVIAPLVTTVAFVLYFSLAAATMIAVSALVFGSGFWISFAAWLATILVMQAGFAVSTLLIAVLGRRGPATSDGRGKRKPIPLAAASRPAGVAHNTASTVGENGHRPAGH